MANSTYELFLPRGTLSKPKSLSKRMNAVQVFQDAMEKISSRIKVDFNGTQRWIVVIKYVFLYRKSYRVFLREHFSQPCLHTSHNRPKNRYRNRHPTSKGDRKRTTSAHYTAYGYLSAASASSQLNKNGPVFANRWWMHVDAKKHVDYAPHRRRGKMWRKKVHGKEIVPLAVCAPTIRTSTNQKSQLSMQGPFEI